MLWKGRAQEIRLQIQDCYMFELWKGCSPESGMSQNKTHTRLKKMLMNQVQRSLSKQCGELLFKTMLRMIIALTVRNTKEVQNIVMD